MFAVTSIVNSVNPYLFYSIKEFLNQELPKDFNWYVFISNSNPTRHYLNDAVRTFKNVNFVIQPCPKDYLDAYTLSIEKTLNYNFVIHFDLNSIVLPQCYSGCNKYWFKYCTSFLPGMKYDVILLDNTNKSYSNSIIKEDISEQKRETTMKIDGICYTNTNKKVYHQPHIRTKQTSKILLDYIKQNDMFSIFTLRHAILEQGLIGDILEWKERLEEISYGPFKYDNNNFNVNCHIPILLLSVNSHIHTVFDNDHLRPIYYCWKTNLSKNINIKNINKLLVKYNPRAIISVDNDDVTGKELSLPFEYRKRWIKCDDINKLSIHSIETLVLNGIFKHPNSEQNPLISVITCTYESKDRILKPIKSLLEQTYTNWEWIIIDDSITDDTWKTLQNYTEDDYRIKIYKRPKNDGSIGKNKQFCGNLAMGKFIFELDHDDDIHPQTFEIMLNAAKKYPDAGFFYSDCSEIFEDTLESFNYGEYYSLGFGSYYMSWWRGRYHWTSMTARPNPHTLRHIVGVPNHFRCWTREAYLDIGSHNANLQVVDDYELILRTFLKYKFCHIPMQLYIQYRNAGGDNFTFHRNALIQYYTDIISRYYNKALKERFDQLQVRDNVHNGKRGYDKVDWEVPYFEYTDCHYVYNPKDNDETPLISIIVDITSESPDKLHHILNDIFNQTYQNFEVIIVGNKSVEWLEHFMNFECKYNSDDRIKWTNTFKKYNDNNTCRNYGIKMLATGRYITYTNNKWNNNHLQLAMDAFRKNKNLDIVVCHNDRDNISYRHLVHKKTVLYKTGLFTDECVLENSVNNFTVYYTDVFTVQ
uniref:Glycosyltransferase 2-like domain-containing protein n=1 Tax=viral metagenome TaxID=1070528 RepID=A0A6C0HDV7_9ZZZZ